MKAKEWREKSSGEREKMIAELRDKLRTVRFGLVTREIKNNSEYQKIKKDIARLLTLQREDFDETSDVKKNIV
ncbi:MAG: 50S ribosomal protein L29 [Candidatus Moranbacteria bacterium]|nr:50S ribosomal protein L29 [Candidatus Moranbacteria bacterium]